MPKPRSNKNKKLVLVVIGVILLIFFGKILLIGVNYVPVLFQLIFNKEVSLKKSNENINILLLGIGGGKHDGPNLSDTIIFASVNQSKNKVTLVSLPRDMWIPDLNSKINQAYAAGEEKRSGGGLTLAKAVVSKVVGQPVDYVVRVDFAGFVKAVDMVGGLDINVENTLDDYIYPVDGKEDDSCGKPDSEIKDFTDKIASDSASTEESLALFFTCRYKHVHFSKGSNHLSGDQALEYVRSRHALGVEGSDFARSARQQKVIKAFKDKIFSLGIILNPTKVSGLYDIFKSSIDTDIKQGEMDDFIRLGQSLKNANITNAVVDFGDYSTGRAGLLINPTPSAEYEYAWVLIPRIGNGNFSEIGKYVGCEIKTGGCVVSATQNP